MSNLDREEQELRNKLAAIERQREADAKHDKSLKLCVGKYFKRVKSYYTTTATLHTYLHVLGLNEEGTWKGYIDIDMFDLYLDRSRWELKDDVITFHNPRAKTSVKARNREYSLGAEKKPGYSKIKPTNVNTDKSGKVYIHYGSDYYSECSQEEYEQSVSAMHQGCEAFIKAYDSAMKSPALAPAFTEVELKAINDLVAKIDNKEVTLAQLTKAAKKVAKFNYFDKNNQLPELVQYERSGDKGLKLSIEGGDGGTDYEPYVTHYYIRDVSIDWAKILYPIRQQIKGKVMDLVEKLDVADVYEPSSWECVYDSSGYDATFEKAYLKPAGLEIVNALIRKNLK